MVSKYLFSFLHYPSFLFFSFFLPSTLCILLISVPPPAYSETYLQEFKQMSLMTKSKMKLNFGLLTHFSSSFLVTWFVESMVELGRTLFVKTQPFLMHLLCTVMVWIINLLHLFVLDWFCTYLSSVYGLNFCYLSESCISEQWPRFVLHF